MTEARPGHDFGRIRVHADTPVRIARQEDPAQTSTTSTTAAPDAGTTPVNQPDAGPAGAAAPDAGAPDAGTQADDKTPKKPAPPPRRKVCLTFDDGPHAGTKDVLGALGSNKATFFLTGKQTASPDRAMQAEMLTAILSGGHRIGNHTLTHIPAKKSAYEKLQTEPAEEQKKVIQGGMKSNQEYFEKLYEEQKATFEAEGITALPSFEFARLPGSGKEFPQFVKLVKDMGLIHVPWNTEFTRKDTSGLKHLKFQDWLGVKDVRGEAKGCPANNWIILSHDSHWAGQQAKLKEVFDALQTKCNCDFGTLDPSGKCS